VTELYWRAIRPWHKKTLSDIPHMNRQPDRRLRDFGFIGNALCPESAQDSPTTSQSVPLRGRWNDLVVIKAHLHITDLVHAVIPEKRESEGFHMSSRWLLLAASCLWK